MMKLVVRYVTLVVSLGLEACGGSAQPAQREPGAGAGDSGGPAAAGGSGGGTAGQATTDSGGVSALGGSSLGGSGAGLGGMAPSTADGTGAPQTTPQGYGKDTTGGGDAKAVAVDSMAAMQAAIDAYS